MFGVKWNIDTRCFKTYFPFEQPWSLEFIQELKHLTHLLPKIRSPEKLLVLLGQGWAAGVVMDRSEQDEEAESWPPGSSPRASRGRDSPSTSPSECQFDCSISDVQPDFTCHNFKHDGHRKPIHQSLHCRRKKKQCKGNFWNRGSEVEALSTHSSLQSGLVRQSYRTPGSRSRSVGTALTDNVPAFLVHELQPVDFLLLCASPTTAQLFVWQEASLLQTLSLSFVSLSPLASGMCAQSRKCQTGVGLLDVWLPAPHTESFTAPLLLYQPDWIFHVQTHTFIRSSL